MRKTIGQKLALFLSLIYGEIGGLVAKEGWEHNSEGNNW
jgi:hypothetical protein